MREIIPLFLAGLMLLGCDTEKSMTQSESEKAPHTIAFQTIIQTGVSGVKKAEKVFKIIRNADELHRFYPKIETELADSIDFAHETVLGAYGGDDIHIVALEEGKECTQVEVKVKEFAETSPFYGIPYSPMHLVKVAGKGSCFRFEEAVDIVR